MVAAVLRLVRLSLLLGACSLLFSTSTNDDGEVVDAGEFDEDAHTHDAGGDTDARESGSCPCAVASQPSEQHRCITAPANAETTCEDVCNVDGRGCAGYVGGVLCGTVPRPSVPPEDLLECNAFLDGESDNTCVCI